MTVKRMDNVGIVVEDIDGADRVLRLYSVSKLQGRSPVEGDWVDGVTGLRDMGVKIAMTRTPDGHSRLELSCFLHRPWSPITAALQRTLSATYVSCSPSRTSTIRSSGSQSRREARWRSGRDNMNRLCYIRGQKDSSSARPTARATDFPRESHRT